MPAAEAGGASEAGPPAPLAGAVGGVPLGMSEPYEARLPGGGAPPAIIGAGVPAEAGAGGGAWLATGVVGAAGGGAEADAGVTLVAACGGAGA